VLPLAASGVLRAEALQGCGDALRPVRRTVGQHIGAAGRLEQAAGVEEREEVHDASPFAQTVPQEAGGAVAELRWQLVEHGQGAQGEASVVEVGAALPAGEAAVGVLGGLKIGDVPVTARFG
jgi:hypothetical protein